MTRKRLDAFLVEKKLIGSREKAKRLILAGKIFVNGNPVSKAGHLVNIESNIEIKEKKLPFVSRGGLKLAGALNKFDISVKGLSALDIGASTGGFTDCLLQNGVKKVYAIDVGYGQLAWKIRIDPRVITIEKKNARFLTLSDIGEKVDLAVIDLSFISIKLVLKTIVAILNKNGNIIALVKPQFEVGKGEVEKGGIVRNARKHTKVVNDIYRFAENAGLNVLGFTPSPITGAKGNTEFFFHFSKPAELRPNRAAVLLNV